MFWQRARLIGRPTLVRPIPDGDRKTCLMPSGIHQAGQPGQELVGLSFPQEAGLALISGREQGGVGQRRELATLAHGGAVYVCRPRAAPA